MELINRISEEGRWADLCSEPSEADLQEKQVLKTQICSFWKKGKCKRGSSCTFAHGNDELNEPVVLQVVPCAFYRAGFCRLGNKCRNVHDDAAVAETIPQVCEFTEKQSIAAPSLRRGNSEQTLGRPKPASKMVTKKQICSYWEKGKCTRGSSCLFAHGSEELNQSTTDQFFKTSLCKYYKAGRCNLGSKCRQAHSREELTHFTNERFAERFEEMANELLASDDGKEVAEVADDKESTLDGDQKSLSDAVESEGTSSAPDTDILRSPLLFPHHWPEVALDNDAVLDELQRAAPDHYEDWGKNGNRCSNVACTF